MWSKQTNPIRIEPVNIWFEFNSFRYLLIVFFLPSVGVVVVVAHPWDFCFQHFIIVFFLEIERLIDWFRALFVVVVFVFVYFCFTSKWFATIQIEFLVQRLVRFHVTRPEVYLLSLRSSIERSIEYVCVCIYSSKCLMMIMMMVHVSSIQINLILDACIQMMMQTSIHFA